MSGPRKKQQMIITCGLVVAAGAGVFVLSKFMDGSTVAAVMGADPGITTTMVEARTSGASPEAYWVNTGRDKIESLEASVAMLTEALEIERNSAAANLAELETTYETALIDQQRAINDLAAKVGGAGGAVPAVSQSDTLVGDFIERASARMGVGGVIPPFGDRSGDPATGVAPMPIGTHTPGAALPAPVNRDFAQSFTLAAAGQGDQSSKKEPIRLSSYLPAGSYAPAIVLSGVDASTGVRSQSEPIPVLFRINGPAVTAGVRSTNGRRIDLTGCTVTGSATGDLSSERVHVRLSKLACVLPGEEVFETSVAGYMSYSGKAGARGLVVSREGKLVSAAAISGALSGLAQGINGVSSAGAGADAANLNQVLNAAGASTASGAVSGAATLLSEYYIERAEQYQPVVSLYGGTAVEVVFLEGVSLE